MWRTKIVVVTVGAVLTTGLAACSDDSKSGDDAKGGTTKVTLVVSQQSNQNYLPLTLADRLGFFKKQGLDVKINNVQAAEDVSKALLSGQAQGALGFYDHTISLQSKGKQTEGVIQLLQAPGMVEMARTNGDVDSAKDLSGKTVGVTVLAGSSANLARYVAVHAGIDLKKVTLAEVHAGPTFVAAFQHNRVDAGVTTEPTISTLLQKHLGKIIADMRTLPGTKAALGGPYPATNLTVQTSWEKKNPKTTQKLVNAFYEALQWISSHSAEQITDKVPADFYSGPGKKGYSQALANQMGMFNPTGRMPTDGPQTVLRVLQAIDPTVKGKKIDVQQTYTDKYVQESPDQVKKTS